MQYLYSCMQSVTMESGWFTMGHSYKKTLIFPLPAATRGVILCQDTLHAGIGLPYSWVNLGHELTTNLKSYVHLSSCIWKIRPPGSHVAFLTLLVLLCYLIRCSLSSGWRKCDKDNPYRVEYFNLLVCACWS